MLEREIEAHLFKRVKARGGICLKLSPTIAGIPDRLVILPGGRIYFVELKQADGKVSKLQAEQHRRLDALGHPVAVLWDKAQVDLWLEFR